MNYDYDELLWDILASPPLSFSAAVARHASSHTQDRPVLELSSCEDPNHEIDEHQRLLGETWPKKLRVLNKNWSSPSMFKEMNVITL